MRKNLLALVTLLALTTAVAAQDGGNLAWNKAAPKAAIAEAMKQGKPMMLYFKKGL
jgi:hypothetical protein